MRRILRSIVNFLRKIFGGIFTKTPRPSLWGKGKRERMEVGYLTFDGGDYVTGGIAWDLETFEADDAEFIGFEVTTTGYAACYNRTTHKVMVWNGTTEHAQSAISLVFRYIAFGKH